MPGQAAPCQATVVNARASQNRLIESALRSSEPLPRHAGPRQATPCHAKPCQAGPQGQTHSGNALGAGRFLTRTATSHALPRPAVPIRALPFPAAPSLSLQPPDARGSRLATVASGRRHLYPRHVPVRRGNGDLPGQQIASGDCPDPGCERTVQRSFFWQKEVAESQDTLAVSFKCVLATAL